MADFQVVELFESINGEGRFAGELANFVRLKGCNLRCNYCDTAWAYDDDADCVVMTEEEICRKLLDSGIYRVTLTGGEPLFRENIAVLLERIDREEGLALEVETNGSVPISPFREIASKTSFTLDYKLPGSGMEQQMCLENFEQVSPQDTVKFVVSDRSDMEKATEIIHRYELDKKCTVIFSAVFDRIEPVDMVAFLQENKLNHVRVQLQLHKFIWDPQKRGV